MIDFWTGAIRRLDDEHVPVARVVLDAHEDVLVGELEHLGPTELATQIARNLARQLRVRVARVQVELVAAVCRGTAAEDGHHGPSRGLKEICGTRRYREPAAGAQQRTVRCAARTLSGMKLGSASP